MSDTANPDHVAGREQRIEDDAGDAADSPTGSPVHSWGDATVTEPGLDARDNVFFAAVEMTRMPMVLTDPNLADNPIVFCNHAFQELTGYTSEEILGRNCRFLQGVQTDRATISELRDTVTDVSSVSLEILNYKRDGTPFWNAVFIGPVYDKAGALLYFFASQLDVTRRRESEQSFRQAQKMEAIGQLTAGLAHDFNNLLQVVNGNLEILGRRLGDDKLRRHLDNAVSAAERGAKLTRQLLAFARKTRLEPRVVDLSALINDFGDMLDSTLGSRVELRLDLRRRPPMVQVDPNHLEMALLNVLINARDALPEGGVVTVSTRVTRFAAVDAPLGLGEGDHLVLAVSDDGMGMEPHVRERAAEPFFTTKGPGKGTGLGLAMALGFVQQSRGRLEIDSAPGEGTTLRMIFPVAADEAASSSPLRRPDNDETAAGGRERILLVEDSPEVLALAQELLTGLGYSVVSATNGDEGLRAFEAAMAPGGGGLDLLFTDLVMPGAMNGLVLADEVRRRAPTLPILFTTGYNEELVADGPRAASMDVLGKPYRRNELADRVRGAIDRGVRPAGSERRSTFGPAEG